jgi:hypothetical protein
LLCHGVRGVPLLAFWNRPGCVHNARSGKTVSKGRVHPEAAV